MRCVASAKSCRRRSTSCCQCSAISDELHKLLCGICPFFSFDIFFLSHLVSSLPLVSVERHAPFLVKSEEGNPAQLYASLWTSFSLRSSKHSMETPHTVITDEDT